MKRLARKDRRNLRRVNSELERLVSRSFLPEPLHASIVEKMLIHGSKYSSVVEEVIVPMTPSANFSESFPAIRKLHFSTPNAGYFNTIRTGQFPCLKKVTFQDSSAISTAMLSKNAKVNPPEIESPSSALGARQVIGQLDSNPPQIISSDQVKAQEATSKLTEGEIDEQVRKAKQSQKSTHVNKAQLAFAETQAAGLQKILIFERPVVSSADGAVFAQEIEDIVIYGSGEENSSVERQVLESLLANLKNLRSLEVWSTRQHPEAFVKFRGEKLRRLRLFGGLMSSSVSYALHHVLTSCPELEELEITSRAMVSWNEADNFDLASRLLIAHPRLTKLRLAHSFAKPVKFLLPMLTRLALEAPQRNFISLGKSPLLQKLSIQATPAVLANLFLRSPNALSSASIVIIPGVAPLEADSSILRLRGPETPPVIPSPSPSSYIISSSSGGARSVDDMNLPSMMQEREERRSEENKKDQDDDEDDERDGMDGRSHGMSHDKSSSPSHHHTASRGSPSKRSSHPSSSSTVRIEREDSGFEADINNDDDAEDEERAGKKKTTFSSPPPQASSGSDVISDSVVGTNPSNITSSNNAITSSNTTSNNIATSTSSKRSSVSFKPLVSLLDFDSGDSSGEGSDAKNSAYQQQQQQVQLQQSSSPHKKHLRHRSVPRHLHRASLGAHLQKLPRDIDGNIKRSTSMVFGNKNEDLNDDKNEFAFSSLQEHELTLRIESPSLKKLDLRIQTDKTSWPRLREVQIAAPSLDILTLQLHPSINCTVPLDLVCPQLTTLSTCLHPSVVHELLPEPEIRFPNLRNLYLTLQDQDVLPIVPIMKNLSEWIFKGITEIGLSNVSILTGLKMDGKTLRSLVLENLHTVPLFLLENLDEHLPVLEHLELKAPETEDVTVENEGEEEDDDDDDEKNQTRSTSARNDGNGDEDDSMRGSSAVRGPGASGLSDLHRGNQIPSGHIVSSNDDENPYYMQEEYRRMCPQERIVLKSKSLSSLVCTLELAHHPELICPNLRHLVYLQQESDKDLNVHLLFRSCPKIEKAYLGAASLTSCHISAPSLLRLKCVFGFVQPTWSLNTPLLERLKILRVRESPSPLRLTLTHATCPELKRVTLCGVSLDSYSYNRLPPTTLVEELLISSKLDE